MNAPIKIIDILLAALFFSFAWFQRNDVDPKIYTNPSSLDAALWLVFYLIIGVLLLVVAWKKVPAWILIICALACVAQMVISGPGLFNNLFGGDDFTMTGESMSPEKPQVELSREFFGAVIALVGVSWIWIQHRSLK